MLLGCGAGAARLRSAATPFVAGAVVLCAALLLLFVALPVAAGAGRRVRSTMPAASRSAALAERHRPRAHLGPGLPGRRRALRRRLEHALPGAAHRGRHDRARHDARAGGRARRAAPEDAACTCCRAAADHHAAVRRRPRPDPAVRPRRLVNQVLESAFGITPTRWFYGLSGRLAGAAVRVHADRLPDHARRRRTASARRSRKRRRRCAPSRWTTFRTVTLPLLKPGLANAFLVGFIESIADFGNPIVVGGQYCGAVDRDLLRHRRRAVRPGPRRLAGAGAARRSRSPRSSLQQQRARPRRLHHRLRQGRRRPADAAARAACRGSCSAIALPWLAFTVVIYVFAFVGGFVAHLGPRLHADAAPLRHRVRPAVGRARRRPGLGRHRLELAVHDR